MAALRELDCIFVDLSGGRAGVLEPAKSYGACSFGLTILV